jgi:thymidylate synthase
MNSWNPSDLDKMALPPCHVMCQFNVNTKKRTLDCQLYQRSGDMFLGVPFNIASYAFLLHIIANLTGYIPGRLIHILGDTHIYEEHLEAVNEQLSRVPVEFPQLIIKDPTGEQGVLRRLAPILNIDSLNEDMFEMRDYKSYDKISAPMIA